MLMLFFIALQDYEKLLSSKHARFLSAVSKHKCGPLFIGWTPTHVHTHTHTHTHTHMHDGWLDFAVSFSARWR